MKPIIYKNWKLYIPEETPENAFFIKLGAQFLRDETGVDWYDLQKEIAEKYADHYFLSVDSSTGIILGAGKDHTTDFPDGMHYAIIDKVPDGLLDIPFNFKLSKGKIVPDNTVKISRLTEYISEEITWASSQISALDDIQEFGTPTEEEKERLLALRRYRFVLTRTKPEENPDIDLPNRP